MSQSKELKKIKKIYGEKFSHLCRELFPQILEQEGMLLQILQEKFSKNCDTLYENIKENELIDNFKELIYNIFDRNREEQCEKDEEKRNPYEILDEAGYDLYECLTEDDIQRYEKYYAPNEVLCTIYNGGRLNSKVCFGAVKKDVNKIKRENFKTPKKSDEYSTSVLAIQFDRCHNSNVQIISRYNHTVPNPNCTLNNNLDNIAEGLQESFARVLEERGCFLNETQAIDFEIPGYTLAGDGKYYKYNLEIDGKYYCPGNIIIENGVAREIGKPEEVILSDYFKIDLKKGKIESLIEDIDHDSFVDDLMDIEKIEVKKDKEERKKKIYIYKKREEEKNKIQEPIIIELDKDNQIIGYINKDVQTIGDNFLGYNEVLTKIDIPQVQIVGDYFLWNDEGLTKLDLPKVRTAGDYFLHNNKELIELNMPQVKTVGGGFLLSNKELTKLYLPQIKTVRSYFLYNNKKLTELNMPQLKTVEHNFLKCNKKLTELNMPEVKIVGSDFLLNNEVLTKLNMPEVETVGDGFLLNNKELTELNLPQVQIVGNDFLSNNEVLTKLDMPQIRTVGDFFLKFNEVLTELNMPQVQSIGDFFLVYNQVLPKDVEKIRKLSRMKYITPKEALKSALEQVTTTKSFVQNVIKAEKDQSQIDTPKEGERLNEY